MRKSILSFVRRAIVDQSGQTLTIVALGFGTLGLLGVGGLVVDVGHAYVVRSQLQNAANAAALAAAGLVYTSSSEAVNTTTQATQYGATGTENPNPYAYGTPSIKTVCLNALMPTGSTCSTGSPANAVKVTETAKVPTFMMAMFKIPTLTVSATATASMQGLANQWNVAIVVDGTQSMSTKDTNCGGLTEFQCALSGVQAFLSKTNPCPSGISNCTPASANLRVSLFSFPNLSTSSGFSDTNTCAGPFTNEVYTLPATNATTYVPMQYTGKTAITATYQMTSWDTGYYDPGDTSTGGLNPSDNLVKTVGYGYNSTTGAIGKKGCLPNVGGESTYYGGVIYAAQAALVQAQATYPGSLNAMILLSDGQAEADSSKFPVATSTPSTSTPGIAVKSAGSSTTNLTGATKSFGLYPDYNDECQQAIVAAQSAATAGTRVYAVAYGSESSGCTGSGGTDTSLVATGQNTPFTLTGSSQLTPCVTMENIASDLQYFYSDYNKSGSGSTCQDASHPVTTLSDIFLAISANFTKPRLVSNSAT